MLVGEFRIDLAVEHGTQPAKVVLRQHFLGFSLLSEKSDVGRALLLVLVLAECPTEGGGWGGTEIAVRLRIRFGWRPTTCQATAEPQS